MKYLASFFFAIAYTSALPAESFYRDENALFSMRPAEDKAVAHLTRVGPVGISLDLRQPAFTMYIKSVEPGSPAATAGLRPEMVIESINGGKLAAIDPRIQLGNWITEAEATDGRLAMKVSEKPGGAAREIVVNIPVFGRYSATWPLDCPKSEKIVRNFAEYLKKPGSNQGFADIGMLFLLSTGDESDFEHVKKWAQAHKGGQAYPWHIGYGGLALCEYYLRTGDASVLPAIQRKADALVGMENFGGWAGRGGTASLNYGGGGGHLNAGGTLCVGYLMLAKECGATVPDETLKRVLANFYRYAGRGMVSYGKGKPERGFTDNGKNGKLAFSMAAAAALDPKGENSIYARARDVSSQFAFYSTSYMLHGHTGGGIGEIWRSASMGLMRDKLPKQYREFMDNRRWHYELSRRFDGSFAILGGERYDDVEWGAGYALTYTVPRKTLRLTGAPPTKFSKPFALPERPWGTAEDDDFESIQPAACPKGEAYDLAAETFADGTGMAMIRRIGGGDLDEATLRKFIRHPNIEIRGMAARSIPKYGEALLMELLACDDARIRRTALESLHRAADKLMSRKVFDHVLGMLRDPEESWFVKEMALQAVGKAKPDWLTEKIELVLPFIKHKEWWLQHSALTALVPVAADERCYRKVLPAIGDLLETNYYFHISGILRWGAFPETLRKAPPQVQQLARECLKEAYTEFVDYDHRSEQVEKVVNPMTLEAIADSLVQLPGGYDALYQIGRQSHPGGELPFKEIFLKADPQQLSPELRKIVDQAVGGNLIPAYVQKNLKILLKEAASEEVKGGAIEGLTDLYRKVGVNEYDWQGYGPQLGEMTWHYHSFDPAEKWLEPDDRLGRFRAVTFPPGMEKWFETGFDPNAAGWKTGKAPFGAADGKLGMIAGAAPSCDLSFCKCGDPVQTLWEKDVLLIRGTFDYPTFEEGYRYRFVHGGISHVGSGGGFRLYVNGKLFYEDRTGVDRRGGENPEGRFIPKDWWPAFDGGRVELAAITFKKHHPRTKKYGGNISIFMQRMKVPPLADE